jgi:hypothetical protein
MILNLMITCYSYVDAAVGSLDATVGNLIENYRFEILLKVIVTLNIEIISIVGFYDSTVTPQFEIIR